MGKKNKSKQKTAGSSSEKKQEEPKKTIEDFVGKDSEKKQEDLYKTLEDFTSKENWDEFFTLRGTDDNFEWYAEWPQLQSLLTSQLSFQSKEQLDSAGAATAEAKVNILVPGCGNSKLSEHLYDAGFKNITNVDFSKVVIKDMLKRNVRERPEMKWRVMDMTSMQFGNETFDAIVDKGGLDALMEPKLGPDLGYLYLVEAKRVVKVGGKYVCLTLAEAHVLDLLLLTFRFGWKMSIYSIQQLANQKLQTFMVVAEKDSSVSVFDDITLFVDKSGSHGKQALYLQEALEREKKIRLEYLNGSDITYSLQDLLVGAKGNLKVLEPGRREKVVLGGPGVSRFVYNGVLLDAKEGLGFIYHYGIFIVPHNRAHDWLFSSEEGQRLLATTTRAARLLMIILDSSNSNVAMEFTQMDLSPLVKQLAPGHYNDSVQIPFLTAGDGVTERDIVYKVTSAVTGPIVVEDVVYGGIDDDDLLGCKFRRLNFQRTENLVQSEALLSTNGSIEISLKVEKDEEKKASKLKNNAPSGELKVIHNILVSSYHNGIISGILLLSSRLKVSTSLAGTIKTAVIGLGAGLLPMFMKNYLPGLMIEVVELDPVILRIAREYFGLLEDSDHFKVHITDGIEFVKERANPEADGNNSSKFDILVVDVDSADTSSGLTCPAADFVEESFLLTVKDSLAEQGLFIINLVSRSYTVKHEVKSRIEKVFSSIFSLQLEEDINEVIFAVKTDSPMKKDQLSEARDAVAKSLMEMDNEEEWKVKVLDLSKRINLVS